MNKTMTSIVVRKIREANHENPRDTDLFEYNIVRSDGKHISVTCASLESVQRQIEEFIK